MTQHPVGQRAAALFHSAFVALYMFTLGFHAVCAWNHWRDRYLDK